jgi:hypothetical protein
MKFFVRKLGAGCIQISLNALRRLAFLHSNVSFCAGDILSACCASPICWSSSSLPLQVQLATPIRLGWFLDFLLVGEVGGNAGEPPYPSIKSGKLPCWKYSKSLALRCQSICFRGVQLPL